MYTTGAVQTTIFTAPAFFYFCTTPKYRNMEFHFAPYVITLTLAVALYFIQHYLRAKRAVRYAILNECVDLLFIFAVILAYNDVQHYFAPYTDLGLAGYVLALFSVLILLFAFKRVLDLICRKVWPVNPDIPVVTKQISRPARIIAYAITMLLWLASAIFFCFLWWSKGITDIQDTVMLVFVIVCLLVAVFSNARELYRLLKA